MADITSRPFKPNPDMVCEACVFGRGKHADFCTNAIVTAVRAGYEILTRRRVGKSAPLPADYIMCGGRPDADSR